MQFRIDLSGIQCDLVPYTLLTKRRAKSAKRLQNLRFNALSKYDSRLFSDYSYK